MEWEGGNTTLFHFTILLVNFGTMKYFFSIGLVLPLLLLSCKSSAPSVESKTTTGYQGQPKSPIVPTVDVPVQKQWKGIWASKDSSIFFSNEFDGARLNGLSDDGNYHFTALVTAENTPINGSPWYAFKIWGKEPKDITLKLAYQNSRSRYYPKISKDGVNFRALDSTKFQGVNPGEGKFGLKAAPEFAQMSLRVGADTLWVSAQELYPSKRVFSWMDSLASKPFIKKSVIGHSKEGRPMRLLQIKANPNNKKAILVISRQHPPEVTGFLAMKSFVETLASESEEAKQFRATHDVFVVPLMNPDGVDNGHWRHNMGGVDLNRDWQNFNQPETQSVRNFLKSKEKDGYEFVFGADFHSTWDDIYYPLDTLATGPKGKIVFDWIAAIGERLPQKKTNVKASKDLDPTMVSRTYFFVAHGMPAIVFELGDNTPRPFLNEKGKVAAQELMRLLMN
ncbi:Peptidase M14 carboxypeptidase A [Croceitalea dokdonensis DOKDO 023]|uniref:Peptidase M14 carboxypeptidase A n=2 Tax=Croceitalea TaxID=574891 RepID=A0A0N8H4F1_9FLAO|nr:Peptidase M14 carboxypeptidase A [Croceitalea dokdonensis DOKDO 023]